MRVIETLDQDNFVLYAFRHYRNPQCSDIAEFYDDLHRFKYLKKLLNRHINADDLAERLILNHLIVIQNVFGIEPAMMMIKYKFEDRYWPALKPFLLYLNFIGPEDYPEIELDADIVHALRNNIK